MRVLLLTMLMFGFVQTTLAYPAHSEKWAHRSVIYFAPTNDEHVKQFLLETLMIECELAERDVVTLVITEDGFTVPSWVREEFNLSGMFHIYDVVPGEHTAVLVGKDGMEKLRWGKKTNWDSIKSTIDKMPLRQYEMAQNASPCSA
ncbi:hypothetical protein NL53_18565 [Vibrio variabilis]|uniref:DUF4174 domain-containing protein n=4 Tax=Vibrio TaxID=662 RepID=A0ABR4Y6Z0_9VIBR|nr:MULTISPECIES: DUF4174 domain-containing protein [Vibrio]EED27454.1 conserved hypothetical protein [Vibrio sp. 16]KHA59045.1 hypothetical protein NL53_18565 [Vibrio variabilis]KHD25700.1 hypothetical protein NM09_08305 [Vibrio caribbeanicus]KHT47348.1 hypothetical protein RJ47_00490 [Vibrio sinaloensis]KIE21349.1 hypothetical protein SE23_03730 [Vibrio sinaloensis]